MQELDDLTAYALATELGIDDEVLEVVARRELPAYDQTDGFIAEGDEPRDVLAVA